MSSNQDSGDLFEVDSPSPTPAEANSINGSYHAHDALSNFDSTQVDSPPPVYGAVGELPSDLAYFSSETNGNGLIHPPPSYMEQEESLALREWRRENKIRLEKKEKREKELLSQILIEAEQYKMEFHQKIHVSCEANKAANRETEKVFVSSHEKFHAEADKDYWKSIAELIPKEVPTIEKRQGKKDKEKKPSVVVIQGPKPGRPTDLSRMRQLLLKLKHDTPLHLNPSKPPLSDAKTDASTSQASPASVSTEVVAVA